MFKLFDLTDQLAVICSFNQNNSNQSDIIITINKNKSVVQLNEVITWIISQLFLEKLIDIIKNQTNSDEKTNR